MGRMREHLGLGHRKHRISEPRRAQHDEPGIERADATELLHGRVGFLRTQGLELSHIEQSFLRGAGDPSQASLLLGAQSRHVKVSRGEQTRRFGKRRLVRARESKRGAQTLTQSSPDRCGRDSALARGDDRPSGRFVGGKEQDRPLTRVRALKAPYHRVSLTDGTKRFAIVIKRQDASDLAPDCLCIAFTVHHSRDGLIVGGLA